MQYRDFVFCANSALVCILTGCGGPTPAANSPDSIEQAAMTESSEPTPTTGRGMEVGMEFEEKGDDAAEKRDRTPPPTPTAAQQQQQGN